jgi:hypothetical protein
MKTSMKHFIVAVHHDTAKIKICTTALSPEGARQLVMAAGGCPLQAIISVEEVRRTKYSVT